MGLTLSTQTLEAIDRLAKSDKDQAGMRAVGNLIAELDFQLQGAVGDIPIGDRYGGMHSLDQLSYV